MDDTTTEVVTAEDCTKPWKELTAGQQAYIESKRMYWTEWSIEDNAYIRSSAEDVWNTLSVERRRDDIVGTDRSVVDALLDRVLQRTVTGVLACGRSWATAIREQVSAPDQANDMRTYAADVVRLLQECAGRYDTSDPAEADNIRIAIAKLKKLLPASMLEADQHVERRHRVGRNDVEMTPAQTTPDDQPGSESGADPVHDASASGGGFVTTTTIIKCFGSYMGLEKPRKSFGSHVKWAARNDALIQRGLPGMHGAREVSQWNAVQFAINLLKREPYIRCLRRKLTAKDLDLVFESRELKHLKKAWFHRKFTDRL